MNTHKTIGWVPVDEYIEIYPVVHICFFSFSGPLLLLLFGFSSSFGLLDFCICSEKNVCYKPRNAWILVDWDSVVCASVCDKNVTNIIVCVRQIGCMKKGKKNERAKCSTERSPLRVWAAIFALMQLKHAKCKEGRLKNHCVMRFRSISLFCRAFSPRWYFQFTWNAIASR